MTAQLSIIDLSKTYPNGTPALKGISLDPFRKLIERQRGDNVVEVQTGG